MIEITASAQEYFADLIERQGMNDVGLQLSVLNPGTPGASCDLQFRVAGESAEPDLEFPYEQFILYVPASSESWLDKARIDFEESETGGQLTIRAPGIRGTEPDDSSDLAARVNWLLDAEINPGLASHGGMVRLETVTAENEVVLRFGGGCQGCGMVSVTLKEGIEKTLKEHFPEVTAVVDATDHDSGDNPYYQ
jgi:Fe/S biogenesis protein NfuA